MKEADIFESWINTLAEGTWATPDTPEKLDRLRQLMTEPLIVGADAVDATEQLYDLVGDDQLFDQLSKLAAEDPAADARQIVQQRLEQLGIVLDDGDAADQVSEGDNLATFEAGCDMDETMGSTVAGAIAPLEEGASDYVGNAIEDLRVSMPGLDRESFLDELYTYLDAEYGKQAADAAMDHGNNAEYDELYANYIDLAEQDMAEDAVDDFLARGGKIQQGKTHGPRKSEKTDYGSRHIGGQRDAVAGKAGKTLGRAAATNFMGGGKAVVGEGGCNATMEGEMCAEHGLAECDMHESVAESRDSDALLARIKSLALIK